MRTASRLSVSLMCLVVLPLLYPSTSSAQEEDGDRVVVADIPFHVTAAQQKLCFTYTPSRMAPSLLEAPPKIELPPWADRAMVFLNGWKLEYLDHDNEIDQMRVHLTSVQVADGVLSYNVRAQLNDDSRTDPFRACAYIMFAAWNSAVIRVHADSSDDSDNVSTVNALGLGQSSMLPEDRASSFGAVFLTRGFDAHWNPTVDHHLASFSYETQSTSLRQKFFMTDDGARDASSTDYVTRVSPSEGYEHQQFSTLFLPPQVFRTPGEAGVLLDVGTTPVGLPAEQECTGGVASRVERKGFSVGGLGDYELVLPVLGGWSLNYDCGDDHHVYRIGAGITNPAFDPSTGQLSFDGFTELRDDDPGRSHVGVLLPVLFVFEGVGPCGGNLVTYDDSIGNWTPQVVSQWGSTQFYTSTEVRGGTTWYRTIIDVVGGRSGQNIAYLNPNAVYDPAYFGEIDTIDARATIERPTPAPATPYPPGNIAGVRLAIRQGGSYFWTEPTWSCRSDGTTSQCTTAYGAEPPERTPVARGPVQTSRFTVVQFESIDDPDQHPRLEAGAPPLELGFIVSASKREGHSDVSSIADVSAWRFEICPDY